MERDNYYRLKGEEIKNFNSHAHVERDVVIWVSIFNAVNFNSHAHVERDAVEVIRERRRMISTHTLTWSVTTAVLQLVLITKISTHTLTWSVTMGKST